MTNWGEIVSAYIILAGLVIGWIRKGSLWTITNIRLRLLWVLPVAYLLQHFSIDYMHGVAYEASILLSYIGLVIFGILNMSVPGVLWALMGTVSNFLVMAANGLRMPAYMPYVRQMNPQFAVLVQAGKIGKSMAMGSTTHLNFLGDIIPFRVWPQEMVSVGDILFGIGLAILIQYGMTLRKGGMPDEKGQATSSLKPRDS